MRKIIVLISDDHAIVRQGLRLIIETQEDIEVGRDLMSEPIERRKERLCTITLDTSVLFSPALDCEPNMLVEQVKQLSLGGVIAKRRGSGYEAGARHGAWVTLPAARNRRCVPESRPSRSSTG